MSSDLKSTELPSSSSPIARHWAVVGLQWGDEGKGKIIDALSAEVDYVVRFQGGNNAGHTLVIDGKSIKLRSLPSGIARASVCSIIGAGVVVDPFQLVEEIDSVRQQGIAVTPEKLWIADNASLLLPIHRTLETLHQLEDSLGTTGQGIGPAYEDKVGRRSLLIGELVTLDRAALELRLQTILSYHAPRLRDHNKPAPDPATESEKLHRLAPRLAPFVRCLPEALPTSVAEKQRFLFEGAQGTMLDIIHGTYPFVTSSCTLGSQAVAGSGIGVDFRTLGVAKAYTTRVGAGPFPSECHASSAIARHLSQHGQEFGTVTGRARRCGWLDLVALRHACALNRVDGLVVTKIDVLDNIESLKLCDSYTLNGRVIDYFPTTTSQQAQLRPNWVECPAWTGSTSGATSWHQLPKEAQNFITRIEDLTKKPVMLVSTGAERHALITRFHPQFGPSNTTSGGEPHHNASSNALS